MKKIIKIIAFALLVILAACGGGPTGINIVIDGNTITNNTVYGITINNGGGNNVTNNNISNNGNFRIDEFSWDAAVRVGVGGNLIANNTIDNTKGNAIFGSLSYSEIANNNITNAAGGIVAIGILETFQNILVSNNRIVNSSIVGIGIGGAGNVSIVSNNISGTNLDDNSILTGFNFLFSLLTNSNFSWGHGIGLMIVQNSTIENNTINANEGFGIFLLLNSTNISVSGNNISGNNLSGIALLSSEANVLNNNISNNGVNGTSFVLKIFNSSILPLGITPYNGILFLNATNSEIFNNTINNNLDAGIANLLRDASIINNTICYNAKAIIDLSANSTISGNNYCNATIEYQKMWQVFFYARENDTLLPINNVNVTDWNANGTEQISGLTNSDGLLYTALIDYLSNASGNFSYNPHTANATRIGYSNDSQTFNVTQDMQINFTMILLGGIPDLEPPTPPVVLDGLNYVDYDWTNSNNSLNASWFNSTDRSLIFYVYRILENGSCYAGNCSATDVGQSTQVSVTNLTLLECNNYSFAVMARDTFFNPSDWAFSDGIVVDLVAPIINTLTSSSHPDENASYINRNIVLEWNASDSGPCPSGIESYSYILDNNNATIPDDIPETNATTVTFYDVEPETWYFHIKAKDFAGSWSNTSHYRIDVVPSEVRIRLNPVESPTFFDKINITGNVNKNVTLVRFFINNNNTQNLTNVNTGNFNFSNVALEIGMNVMYVDAFINDTFVATSNTLYIKRINETKFNVSELDIVFGGGCSGAACGAATDSPVSGSVSGNSIRAEKEGNAMIFITRTDAPITERSAFLQNKSFFEFINPSFGYPLDLETVEVGVLINYPNLMLIGNETVPPGRYIITIRNEGIDNETGRPKINITIS